MRSLAARPPGHRFTYRYAQPADYHFCWDSVIFPEWVAQQVRASGRDPARLRVLDLCAGCGVIGFELAHHLPEIRHLDFLEVQTAYREYFEENRRLTGHHDFLWMEMNYARMPIELAAKYDLIVCNPPYFFKEDGKTGKHEISNRSRFFLDADFDSLIESIVFALREDGMAYLLAKTGERHGRDLIGRIETIAGARGCGAETLADIRGTRVVRIHKLN